MLTLKQKVIILELLRGMRTFNAFVLAGHYHRETDSHLDWHPVSDYLDLLRSRGFIRITQPGGMTEYEVIPGTDLQVLINLIRANPAY